MKIYNTIGIDKAQYEDLKQQRFIDWIFKNSTSPAEIQLCLINSGLRNYFLKEIASINIRYLTHLQLFMKPQTTQQKFDLYVDYLKKFDVFFPKALKPKLKSKQKIHHHQFN